MIQFKQPFETDRSHPGAGPTLAVSVVEPNALDNRTIADWVSLANECEQPNPFFAPWFLRPAMKWLDPENAVRLLLTHDRDTGQLIGLLPITAGSTYARLPVTHVSVWKNKHLYVGTPLIRLGFAKQAMRALVEWIGTCPMGIRFLRLTQLPADGPVYHAMTATCADCEREVFVQSRETRAVLRNGHDPEALLTASQSTKSRAELRRRIRRFDETGDVKISETLLTPAMAPVLSEAFTRLENAGWKSVDDEGFAVGKSLAESSFLSDAMDRGAAEKNVIATVLTRDKDPVAIGFTLRNQDLLFGFKTAFDRRHAKYSPGIRIFHETTRRMLADQSCSLYDSCAMPGHPVLAKLWPDRQESVQVNIPARGAQNAHILRIGAHAEPAKAWLKKIWSAH